MTITTRKAAGPIARVAHRNNDLAKIHILKKSLNLSDDEYRGLLMTICQVDSAAALDMAGRGRFLAHLEQLQKAYLPKRTATKKPFKKLPPSLAKLYSLWQQLYTAKLVGNRSYKALETWAKGQTGVDKLEWLNEAQSGQCIEQLKAWLQRKAP